MSYNLLFDTNFNSINRNWKLVNCEYKDGYLVGMSKVYSIEQEIVLPDPTRLYAVFEYICFDSNVKSVYCGVLSDSKLEVNKKKAVLRKRKRVAVVSSTSTEKITVTFIVEARTDKSRIYIDSPLLIDLYEHNRPWWPIRILNRVFDYRYGYDYTNLYMQSEITETNSDFHSPYSRTEKAKNGIIVTTTEDDWFELTVKLDPGRQYLVKLDLEEINDFGTLVLQYGEFTSSFVNNQQLCMLFKANNSDRLKLKIKCTELLPYIVNLKHILIVDLTNLKIEEEDLKHLPFI